MSQAASSPRYAVGIDLGTSHTVVASAPLVPDGLPQLSLLPIAQRLSAAEVQAQVLLPSVCYLGAADELGQAWLQPWPPLGATPEAPATLGMWARTLGATQPQRLVASSKSWLSHPGVDRTAAILPWGAPAEVHKISPLAASAATLAHVRAAWDATHPDAPLAQQQLVLTVPASFDEGARALTLQAATLAGLPRLQLLEEPKAAFHDWLVLQGEQLAQQLHGSRLVLVVDVGGGTTDVTLVRVDAPPPGTPGALPQLTRVAVGEHLMLGGDNMDLALAHHLEPAFAPAGQRLAPARFAQLVQRCRMAKEQLLAQDAPEAVPVTLLGSGSKLLAHTRTVPLRRADVQQWLVEGFWPLVDAQARPSRRQSALRGLGLPYPADAAITRHLAEFLAQHASEMQGAWPDTLLLNGGVFHAHALAERLAQQLAAWRGAPVRVLHNPHPDWAVARGAAAHGWAHWQQNRPPSQAGQAQAAIKNRVPQIAGGAARSYWLVLPRAEGGQQALCLLPRGTQEGTRITLSGRRFALRLGQAVRFDLVARSSGSAQAGQIVPLEGEGWTELPPLHSVLPAAPGVAHTKVQVQLQACLTEVGTLEVRCERVQDPERTPDQPATHWVLPFAVRGMAPAASDGGVDDAPENVAASALPERLRAEKDAEKLAQALAQIERIFGTQAQAITPKDVRQLRATLEKILGPQESWGVALLRALCDALLAHAKRRRRTPEHERTWLNLVGWCLRPGLGAQLDAWRVQQLWQLYPQGLAHGQEGANWTQWWVLWRRVAAGLNEEQQMQVLEAVAGCMQKTVERTAKARWGSYDDMLRLFAAMEAVPWEYRQEMGQWMLQRLQRPDEPAHTWWAIGRLAARAPLAANAHRVMPPAAAQEFLQAALAQDWRKNEHAMFAAVHIARKTGERTLDLDDATRAQVLDKLRASGAPPRWIELCQEVVQLDAAEQQRSLGDSLPPGLVLLT